MSTSLIADDLPHMHANPLDLAEDLAAANDWTYDRGDDEVIVALDGGYCDYQLRLHWRDSDRLLQVACMFDSRVPDARRGPVFETLARLNERLCVGHFEMWCDEGFLMYRHALLAEYEGGGLSGEGLARLVETAIGECDSYYPVFQFVIWGGKTPREAIDAAMLDTLGEA